MKSFKNRSILGWLGLLMTISKPLFVWFAVLCIEFSKEAGSSAIIFLIIFDIMDGVCFRHSSLAKLQKLARFRRYVDILGDRLGIQWVAWTLFTVYDFPASFYAIAILREILLVFLVIFSFAIRRPIREPNNFSRAAAVCDAASGISWMLFGWGASFGFLVLMSVFACLSFCGYLRTIRGYSNQKSAA